MGPNSSNPIDMVKHTYNYNNNNKKHIDKQYANTPRKLYGREIKKEKNLSIKRSFRLIINQPVFSQGLLILYTYCRDSCMVILWFAYLIISKLIITLL